MDTTRGQTASTTIRRQLTRIVLVPSISFLALWATVTTVGAVQAGALMLSATDGRMGAEAFGSIVGQLREERRLAQIHLGSPSPASLTALEEQWRRTDEAFTAERDTILLLGERAGGESGEQAEEFLDTWEELPRLRSEVAENRVHREAALERYSDLVADAHLVSEVIVMGVGDNGSLTEGVLALQVLRARDEYSQAEALLAGAIAAGGMSYAETAHFTHLTASYRDRLTNARRDMSPSVAARYDSMVKTAPWEEVQRLSRAVVTRDPVKDTALPFGTTATWNSDIPVTAAQWHTTARATDPVLGELTAAQVQISLEQARRSALRGVLLNACGCLSALAAGALAINSALRSSRGLTERLQRLRAETLELSDTRLPDIVSRLQEGRRVDLALEPPPLWHGADEIGQVADAFNTAQRTAVAAAVKQAEIREGANRVFLGIAYRNQTLVQRQLRLLDEMEHAESDPETLRRLFRLDHLVTRGRRYADNLIILGGAHSARRWREPLPLVDVLRAAISETEDYERVRLRSAPKMSVQGFAVADVVHLLAELIENATQFSPEGSAVDVNSGLVSSGLTVDVEDRGLGMTHSAYEAINRTLAEAPEFDVMAFPDEPRLGLFVVARLAERHGVKVRLCPSPYGGTRAVAVLPARLLEEVPSPDTAGQELTSLRLRHLAERTGSSRPGGAAR
ncbi:sensor histidine kinase [Marinactinospora thermotolerans]|uniref:sensor histidine kinase n=1 Tax=Marinactinospora thermotolerans TaxID=531310 RepID=UPI003D8BE6FF